MIEDKPRYQQYPVDKPYVTGPRRVASSSVVAFIIVILLNILTQIYLDFKLESSTDRMIAYKWELIESQTERVNILILGDSSANQGIDPGIVSDILSGRVLNVATIGNWILLDDVWLLETLIDTVGPPDSVILVHVYDVYHRDFTMSLLSQGPIAPLKWDSFGVKPFTFWEILAYGIRRNLPLYYRAESIRRIIQKSITNPSYIYMEPSLNEIDQAGFQRRYEAADNIAGDVQTHLDFVENYSFEISELNEISANRLSELAEIYDIEIYIANTPIYRGLYDVPDFKEYYDDVSDYLEKWGDGNHRIHYLNNVSLFDAEYLQNADHLTVEGAEIYTMELIDLIQKIDK